MDDAFKLGIWIGSTALHGVPSPLNNFMTSPHLLLQEEVEVEVELKGDSEGDEEEEKEVRGTKKAHRSKWGYKGFSYAFQLKEVKASFARLALEKEISNRNLVKKVEELSNVEEELRRAVMEEPMEENAEEKDEGKKMWEKKMKMMKKMKKREKKKKMKRQKMRRQKKRKAVKRRKKREDQLGGQIGGNVKTIVEEEDKTKKRRGR
ncbi:vicilin-like seed storage protein At2g18540 [Malus domestica]|uniref:vicilin-like seed storage protein At2g18540 n=1 Tax=Malus domestica TaxID=3750 RepID=UPI003975EEC6